MNRSTLMNQSVPGGLQNQFTVKQKSGLVKEPACFRLAAFEILLRPFLFTILCTVQFFHAK